MLLSGAHRGRDAEATGVSLFAVLVNDGLAHHVGDKVCLDALVAVVHAQLQGLGFGRTGLFSADEAIGLHAFDDVDLARAGPFGVVDRVESRGRFGQARQHGGFGNGQVFERFAKVGLRSGGKTIRALTQKNLVHVNLKDLRFGQAVFQLEGEQDLVDLAHVAFFGRQIHVARHLHRDGGRALAAGLPQVGQACAHHAAVVHAVVLKKAGVFDGQHRVDHHRRYLADGHQIAPLFTKFAQQITFGAEDSQGQLGFVVEQVVNVGEVGVSHSQGDADDRKQDPHSAHPQEHQGHQQASQGSQGRGAVAAAGGLLGRAVRVA